LNNNLAKSREKCTELERQRALIQQQLATVESELALAHSHVASVQRSIQDAQSQHESQLKSTNASHSHVVDAMAKDKEMAALLQSVAETEHVLDDTAHSRGGNRSSGSIVSYSVEEILAVFASYVESEKDCIEVLSRRVLLLKEKTAHLQREVAEYRTLGMNVSTIICNQYTSVILEILYHVRLLACLEYCH
jgi:hypothetical protein